MKWISRHISPRGIAGLASICAATALISFVGHRSLARLNDQHAQNQEAIAAVREQIESLNSSLAQEQLATIRNRTLATHVNRQPVSRSLAEVASKLPTECRANMIRSAPHDAAGCATHELTVVARCADLLKFSAQTTQRMAPTRTKIESVWIKTNTVCDPTGVGFGWSRDLSATVVFRTESSTTDSLAIAN